MTRKRNIVIDWMRLNPDLHMTLDKACALIGGNIYDNGKFHVGATLSRMVKAGLIVRVKPGVYRLT